MHASLSSSLHEVLFWLRSQPHLHSDLVEQPCVTARSTLRFCGAAYPKSALAVSDRQCQPNRRQWQLNRRHFQPNKRHFCSPAKAVAAKQKGELTSCVCAVIEAHFDGDVFLFVKQACSCKFSQHVLHSALHVASCCLMQRRS